MGKGAIGGIKPRITKNKGEREVSEEKRGIRIPGKTGRKTLD